MDESKHITKEILTLILADDILSIVKLLMNGVIWRIEITMKKIYVTGPVGSGKTTLAKRISEKLRISYHSLDIVMYENDNSKWGNVPRDEDTRNNLFNDIIAQDSWIIEDAGRERFEMGFDKADTIVFLHPNVTTRKMRIIKRYIKQKLKIEECNYNPNLKMLKLMFEWTRNFENGIDTLKMRLKPYEKKVITLNNSKQIKDFVESAK